VAEYRRILSHVPTENISIPEKSRTF